MKTESTRVLPRSRVRMAGSATIGNFQYNAVRRRLPNQALRIQLALPLVNTLMTHSTFMTVVLVLNALWFGVAFRYFSLTPDTAAKLLVPKPARDAPLFNTISASVRFLGGMNGAFAVFAILLLANQSLFPEPKQGALFAAVFAAAHASQFICNVPVALKAGAVGGPLWPVLHGPMLFIFVTDFVLMVANGVLAAMLMAT